MRSFTWLSAKGSRIRSLKGLEHAVNLTTVMISKTRIDDVSFLRSTPHVKKAEYGVQRG
jgi:Leucine-rich repeat (LRR) protein